MRDGGSRGRGGRPRPGENEEEGTRGGHGWKPPDPGITSPWSERHVLELSCGTRAPAAQSRGGKGSLGLISCHNDRKNQVMLVRTQLLGGRHASPRWAVQVGAARVWDAPSADSRARAGTPVTPGLQCTSRRSLPDSSPSGCRSRCGGSRCSEGNFSPTATDAPARLQVKPNSWLPTPSTKPPVSPGSSQHG